jgi:hypothetical protein
MNAPSLWRLAKNSIVLWVGLIFVPIGAVFTAIAADVAMEELAFARHGQATAATIVDKSLQKADFDKNPSTRYLVHYRFATPAGAQAEETREVSVEQWEQLAPGGTMNIRVLSGAQLESRVTQQSNWPAVVAFSALGLILLAVGISLSVFGIREIRRQRRLWRTGITVPAVVTSVAPSSTTINGARQWEIRYAYTDASGRSHKGQSNTMPEPEAKKWRNGDRASARYDPNATESSIWIGNPAPGMDSKTTSA